MDEHPKRFKRKPSPLLDLAEVVHVLAMTVIILVIAMVALFALEAAIMLFGDYMGWPRYIMPFPMPEGPNG